jgi:hypothetical protein
MDASPTDAISSFCRRAERFLMSLSNVLDVSILRATGLGTAEGGYNVEENRV